MPDLKRKDGMTEEQYLWMVGQLIDAGDIENWESVNHIINRELLGEDETTYRTESAWRKKYQAAKKFYDGCFSKMENDKFVEDFEKLNRQLQRNTVKFRDERRAWSKQNYSEARLDETLELLGYELKELGRVNFEEFEVPKVLGFGDEMVILLSDFHIGQTFENNFGRFNTEIAMDRLAKYLVQVKTLADIFHVKRANIVLLGDMISGSIHKTVQITNKEDAIEQVKIATKMISSFCYECCKTFEHVQMYDVAGNHSRLDTKKDALHDERLDLLIGWAVNLSLSHISNFHYMDHRRIDSGICDMNICGKTYLGVHGDFDTMTKQGVSDLCAMIGFFPEGIFRGHMHSPAYCELNGITVVQGGSLSGTGDQYTLEKRIFGYPSQTVCICNKDGIVGHFPIRL